MVTARVRRIARMVRADYLAVAAKEGFSSNLCGLCARASATLHRELARNGIPARIAYCDWHVFVEVDGMAVDITGQQFGGQAGVHIGLVGTRYYWQPTRYLPDVPALIAHLQRREWSADQQPQEGDLWGM